jgi:peptide/nickel transport system substrate-binding protein
LTIPGQHRLVKSFYKSSRRGRTLWPTAAKYIAYTADSRNRAQIDLNSWQADFLAPSNFFHRYSCSSFRPRDAAANENFTEFCDPAIDAKMRQAISLQASDPAQANRLWSKIDRALVDRAPAVPMVNLREVSLVSARAGNYQSHPLWGTLLDQLWVR